MQASDRLSIAIIFSALILFLAMERHNDTILCNAILTEKNGRMFSGAAVLITKPSSKKLEDQTTYKYITSMEQLLGISCFNWP